MAGVQERFVWNGASNIRRRKTMSDYTEELLDVIYEEYDDDVDDAVEM